MNVMSMFKDRVWAASTAPLLGRAFAVALLLSTDGRAEVPTASSYSEHCASCHGVDRLGGSGPALLPENLERLRKPAAADTIAEESPEQLAGRETRQECRDDQAAVRGIAAYRASRRG